MIAAAAYADMKKTSGRTGHGRRTSHLEQGRYTDGAERARRPDHPCSRRPPSRSGGHAPGDGALRIHIAGWRHRSEEHTSELQSLMRNSYAVFCLKKKKKL